MSAEVPRLFVFARHAELRAGDLDGAPMEAYWSWKRQHTLSERLPHGESTDDADRRGRRYRRRDAMLLPGPP